MLRFIRSKPSDLNEAIKCYSNFLQWRLDNNIDEIRLDISNGKNSPYLFPLGRQILAKSYQIILTGQTRDKKNNPISLESYNFSFKEIFKAAGSIDDYVKFIIYTLEYRAMMMEQLSDEDEQKLLAEVNGDESKLPLGYGIVLQNICIRDLKNAPLLSFASTRDIFKRVIAIGSDYYPEFMIRSVIINAPFVFNSVWAVIKQFIDGE